MLVVLSPAKSLDEESRLPTKTSSEPRLLDQAEALVAVMRTKSRDEVADLMSLSQELADLNFERYQDFSTPFTRKNARPAALTFNGDVYMGMAAASFSARDFTEAQKTVRILSGLYGVLRPLDLMQPYRLEMGTKLQTDRGDTLYDFWGTTITDMLNEDLAASPGPDAVINLASVEYFSAVDKAGLEGTLVTPRFLDHGQDGNLRVISFFAKRARGTMARWIVQNRLRSMRGIRDFAEDGYRYDAEQSTTTTPTFVRATASAT